MNLDLLISWTPLHPTLGDQKTTLGPTWYESMSHGGFNDTFTPSVDVHSMQTSEQKKTERLLHAQQNDATCLLYATNLHNAFSEEHQAPFSFTNVYTFTSFTHEATYVFLIANSSDFANGWGAFHLQWGLEFCDPDESTVAIDRILRSCLAIHIKSLYHWYTNKFRPSLIRFLRYIYMCVYI